MAAKTNKSVPTYWSIDADTYSTWVAVLGNAAAGKLMAACAAFFFDGTEPDDFKLTKQARAMFEGERNRMERRRAAATNGRGGGRKVGRPGSAGADNSASADVEKSDSCEETSKKSERSSEKTSRKSTKNPAPAPAPTCEINNSGVTPIQSSKSKSNPQTPTPSARGCGSVTPAEFAAMAVGSGLGYDSPTAYGDMLRAV